MSKKLSNIFLLQRIIKELKENNPDTDYWNKISKSTWNEIIKNKLFKEKCFEIKGHGFKTLQNYSDNKINYLEHEENEDSDQDRDQRAKFKPIFDCITETLNLPLNSWKDGISEEDLLQLIQNFKDNFTPKETNNPDGNNVGSSGYEAYHLGMVIDEIIKQGILKVGDKWQDIIPEITSKSYSQLERDRMGTWKKDRMGIGGKSINILKDLANAFGIDINDFKNGSISTNKKGIVAKFKQAYKKRKELKYNNSILDKYSTNIPISDEEEKILDELKNLYTDREALQYFDIEKNVEVFVNSKSTKLFQEAIKILYDLGHYQILNDRVLDYLPVKLQNVQEIQLLRAHIYGSFQVGEYEDAKDILEDILAKNSTVNFTDIMTSVISNTLRNALTSYNNDKSQLSIIFEDMTNMYAYIFEEKLHYYPAINYAYMLDIGLNLFPNSELFEADTIEGLHLDSQKSIDDEKKSDNIFDRYYATISEAEFIALQGTFERSLLHKELVHIDPSQDMLVRTIRQLDFYMNTLQKEDIEPKQSMQDLKHFLIEFSDLEG